VVFLYTSRSVTSVGWKGSFFYKRGQRDATQ